MSGYARLTVAVMLTYAMTTKIKLRNKLLIMSEIIPEDHLIHLHETLNSLAVYEQ